MPKKKEDQLTLAAAAVAWLFGGWCTHITLLDLKPEGGWQLFLVSLGVQLVLSFAQHTVWKWNTQGPVLWLVGIPLVLIDVLLNYRGLSTYFVRLNTVLQLDTTQPHGKFLLWLIPLFICFLIASVPELLIGQALKGKSSD
jgi:hypothetical protein